MVIFILKVLSALIFYVMPVFEESVNALVPSNGTDGVRKGFDFRDIVRENSKYSPFVDLCPLRIYGGRAVDIKEIPYQVVIRKGVRRGQVWVLICGGSIITNIYVLTAAHCFERKALRTLRLYRVVAGASKSNWFYSQSQQREEIKDKLHSDDEVWRKIVNCFKHAYYNPRYINHDMAVLLLESPVRYSQNIQPIPMLKYTHNIPLEENGLCLVSGYGLMEHRNPSPLLRMVCVPLVTTARCRRYYGRKSITNYQFCAGDTGMDSCQGDSGGPLTYKGYLVGIVSYGGACGEAPGVYTLVTAYTTGAKIPFIRGHCAILRYNTQGILILVFLTFVWNFIVTRDL